MSQGPAQGGADDHADAGHGRPGGNGLRPLLGREHGVEDGQGGRHDERRPEPHDGPPADELARAGRQGGANRAQTEQGQAAYEGEAPAVAVAGPGADKDGGEDQRIGVRDPLQAGGAGVQVTGQGGQCRVEDGVVYDDHEQGQAQHDQDAAPRWMGGAAGPAGGEEMVGVAGIVVSFFLTVVTWRLKFYHETERL